MPARCCLDEKAKILSSSRKKPVRFAGAVARRIARSSSRFASCRLACWSGCSKICCYIQMESDPNSIPPESLPLGAVSSPPEPLEAGRSPPEPLEAVGSEAGRSPTESQPLAGSSATPPKQSRYPSRQALRSKTDCPVCGAYISYHALLYRHKCPTTACGHDTQVERAVNKLFSAARVGKRNMVGHHKRCRHPVQVIKKCVGHDNFIEDPPSR